MPAEWGAWLSDSGTPSWAPQQTIVIITLLFSFDSRIKEKITPRSFQLQDVEWLKMAISLSWGTKRQELPLELADASSF